MLSNELQDPYSTAVREPVKSLSVSSYSKDTRTKISLLTLEDDNPGKEELTCFHTVLKQDRYIPGIGRQLDIRCINFLKREINTRPCPELGS